MRCGWRGLARAGVTANQISVAGVVFAAAGAAAFVQLRLVCNLLEGLVGGGLSAVVCGALLACITPFAWWQAALLSAAIVIMGFFGGLVMSAIKRDGGVKDYGELIPGHGGMMDRIDSICFAAPVFFHLVRYFFTV